jgi:hypothetical protein
MRLRREIGVLLVVLAAARPAAADDREVLNRARELYNQRQFESAVVTADQVRATRPAAADLVAARALLERYRESAAPDDLARARERLRRLDPQQLTPRERAEFIVGMGEALYLESSYGAAAEVFRDAVDREGEINVQDRERALDWWASALARDAAPRPELDRQAVYDRIRVRMRSELALHPGSAAAAYWLAAAARGAGDLQGAWNSAEAGWVRAPLAADHGAALRADIDRLMTQAIIPDRAKALAQPPETLLAAWDRFKEAWSKP